MRNMMTNRHSIFRSTFLMTALLAPLSTTLVSVSASAAPLATAYGKPVERGDYDVELARIKAQFKNNKKRPWSPELETMYKSTLLRARLETMLIAEGIARHKPVVKDADIEAMFKERRASFKDDKGYNAWLAAHGMTAADFRADTKNSLIIDALVEKLVGIKKPTAADVEREVKANPEKWGSPEQVKARQIFIKIPANASDADKDEIRRRVMGIYDRAQTADKKKFAELAGKFNEGPATDGKGFLGEVRKGRMTRVWDEAVFAANNNDVVGPIQTAFGYHIVLVEQKMAPQPLKLKDASGVVMDQLAASYRKNAYKDLLKKLYLEAEVKITEPGVTVTAESFAEGGS